MINLLARSSLQLPVPFAAQKGCGTKVSIVSPVLGQLVARRSSLVQLEDDLWHRLQLISVRMRLKGEIAELKVRTHTKRFLFDLLDRFASKGHLSPFFEKWDRAGIKQRLIGRHRISIHL